MALWLTGCSKPDQAPEATPEPVPDKSQPEEPRRLGTLEGVEFGVGDVETSLKLELTTGDKNDPVAVLYDAVENRKYELSKAQMTVGSPYPEALWVTINLRSTANFGGHAVQVKPKLFLDNREIASFAYMTGSQARKDTKAFEVDIMKHLEEIPDTLLLHSTVDIKLFLDTDESTITVDTPPEPATQTATKLSNPLRIHFDPPE